MENYEKLIDELLQGGTPKEKYEFLVWLLNRLNTSGCTCTTSQCSLINGKYLCHTCNRVINEMGQMKS